MSPSDSDSPSRLDRRTAIQWMMSAAATLAVSDPSILVADSPTPAPGLGPVKGYGPDPVMVKIYQPGDVWPLTLIEAQRNTARALCDVIIPSDETSPSASAVGVPEFIDEWISAPYPAQTADRRLVLEGLKWFEDESQRRFNSSFAKLSSDQQTALCEAISHPAATVPPESKKAAAFFKRFRDLTAGGYYTTPEGMKAIGYVGNLPAATFEGPPLEALRHVGLA